jgi:peptidoglycan hydrolase-like protein with peptidoglycan-binding domain
MADPGPFKRPLYPPSADKGPVKDGDDVVAVKRAISRAGFFDWGEFDDAYNEKIADAVQAFQKKNGLGDSGFYGEETHKKLKAKKVPSGSPNAGEAVFDQKAASLYKTYHPPDKVPDLGPVFSGSKSVLKQDLTHATSGIPLYPAWDDAFGQGKTIIAPEDIKITKASSSNPGDACYAEGKSGLRYWFGHLTTAPAVGAKIAKGKKIGVTCANSMGGGPHVHVGVNVEKLWGSGKQMTHKTSYSHGAPLIGDQLAAGHPL